MYIKEKRGPAWTEEQRKAYSKQYQLDHREEDRIRSRTPEAKAKTTLARQRTRAKLIEALGGCCKICGWTDPRALQVDHINAWGNEEARQQGYKRSTTNHFRKILKDPLMLEKYQLLCANHNWIKYFENKEYLLKIVAPKPLLPTSNIGEEVI